MLKKKVLFASRKENDTEECRTPQWLFNVIKKKYRFSMDAAATLKNRKCRLFISEKEDSFSIDWKEFCEIKKMKPIIWLNPPYGRRLYRWIKKGFEEAIKGCVVVMLLPSRTDTKWFHEFCSKGEIYFLKGRLIFHTDEFIRAHQGEWLDAPFPSIVVVFKGKKQKPFCKFSSLDCANKKGVL